MIPGKKYVLSRHVAKDGDVDFSIIGETEDCSLKGRKRVCIKSVSIIFGDHSAVISYQRDTSEVCFVYSKVFFTIFNFSHI